MDGFDILAAGGVVVLAVGLGLLVPWLAWAVVGSVMILVGLYGARAAARADQPAEEADDESRT